MGTESIKEGQPPELSAAQWDVLNPLEAGNFSPYFDLALYSKLFPEKTPEQAAQIVPILNQCIDGGALTKPSNELTLTESQRIAQAREQFFLWMGWSRPDHPMNRQYKTYRNPSQVASIMPPATVVQSIRFFDALYGDDMLAEHVYRCRRLVLGRSYDGLQKSYTHARRLGRVFGLDEPEVRDKVQRWPNILGLSREMRYFCVRAMVEHNEKLGVHNTTEKRPYTLLATCRTQKILGHITNLDGIGQRAQPRKQETASRFLYWLNSPRRQATI